MFRNPITGTIISSPTDIAGYELASDAFKGFYRTPASSTNYTNRTNFSGNGVVAFYNGTQIQRTSTATPLNTIEYIRIKETAFQENAFTSSTPTLSFGPANNQMTVGSKIRVFFPTSNSSGQLSFDATYKVVEIPTDSDATADRAANIRVYKVELVDAFKLNRRVAEDDTISIANSTSFRVELLPERTDRNFNVANLDGLELVGNKYKAYYEFAPSGTTTTDVRTANTGERKISMFNGTAQKTSATGRYDNVNRIRINAKGLLEANSSAQIINYTREYNEMIVGSYIRVFATNNDARPTTNVIYRVTSIANDVDDNAAGIRDYNLAFVRGYDSNGTIITGGAGATMNFTPNSIIGVEITPRVEYIEAENVHGRLTNATISQNIGQIEGYELTTKSFKAYYTSAVANTNIENTANIGVGRFAIYRQSDSSQQTSVNVTPSPSTAGLIILKINETGRDGAATNSNTISFERIHNHMELGSRIRIYSTSGSPLFFDITYKVTGITRDDAEDTAASIRRYTLTPLRAFRSGVESTTGTIFIGNNAGARIEIEPSKDVVGAEDIYGDLSNANIPNANVTGLTQAIASGVSSATGSITSLVGVENIGNSFKGFYRMAPASTSFTNRTNLSAGRVAFFSGTSVNKSSSAGRVGNITTIRVSSQAHSNTGYSSVLNYNNNFDEVVVGSNIILYPSGSTSTNSTYSITFRVTAVSNITADRSANVRQYTVLPIIFKVLNIIATDANIDFTNNTGVNIEVVPRPEYTDAGLIVGNLSDAHNISSQFTVARIPSGLNLNFRGVNFTSFAATLQTAFTSLPNISNDSQIVLPAIGSLRVGAGSVGEFGGNDSAGHYVDRIFKLVRSSGGTYSRFIISCISVEENSVRGGPGHHYYFGVASHSSVMGSGNLSSSGRDVQRSGNFWIPAYSRMLRFSSDRIWGNITILPFTTSTIGTLPSY